jgi:threonylcarbamoyladenosine tRNA methylthiotransferase MtaB
MKYWAEAGLKAENKISRFSIKTLGCKVNQVESESLIADLTENGWVYCDHDENADLVVINTCAVTAKAAMQARQAIRQSIRNNPGALIVVTGCYAQTQPDQIEKITGVHIIVGQSDKHRISQIIQTAISCGSGSCSDNPRIEIRDIRTTELFYPHSLSVSATRTRPFVKIQDGCNAFCSYCIVPYARGRSRSLPVENVLDKIRRIHWAGYNEIVLTGIHLGVYGADLCPKAGLYELLKQILGQTEIPRIRLSSIEPRELSEDIIGLAQNSGRICNHFHIPLQSGDNRILGKMNRPYTRDDFRQRVASISEKIPDCSIGADILVGFPGETEDAFQNTFDLIEELPVTYLHAFPFSPRKGTPAELFSDQLPPQTIKERLQKIRRLGNRKKISFYESVMGKTVEVLIEGERLKTFGALKGITSNYIPVLTHGPDDLKNRIVPVRIDRVAQEKDGEETYFCMGSHLGTP